MGGENCQLAFSKWWTPSSLVVAGQLLETTNYCYLGDRLSQGTRLQRTLAISIIAQRPSGGELVFGRELGFGELVFAILRWNAASRIRLRNLCSAGIQLRLRGMQLVFGGEFVCRNSSSAGRGPWANVSSEFFVCRWKSSVPSAAAMQRRVIIRGGEEKMRTSNICCSHWERCPKTSTANTARFNTHWQPKSCDSGLVQEGWYKNAQPNLRVRVDHA